MGQRAGIHPERQRHDWTVHRPLVAIAVASPVVVGGLAAVLVAHALVHSWLWGTVALALAVALFAALIAALVRRSRTHPGEWVVFVEGFARARSGLSMRRSDRTGREAKPSEDDRSHL